MIVAARLDEAGLGDWRAAAVQSIDRALGGIIVAGAVVVPLFYTLDISDAFALPKTILVRWLALVCFGLLAMRVALWRAGTSLDPRGRAVLIAVLAYVGLNVLSYALAIDREQSWSGEPYQYRGLLSAIADAVALLATTVALSSTARVRTLFAAMTVGAVMVSLYAIVQAAGLDPVWRDLPKGRAFSTIGQANALAAYLLLALPAAIGLLEGTSRRGRAALGSAIVLIAIGLAATASRGGLLAFVVVLVVLASCLMRRPSRAAVGSAALAVGAILLGLAIVSGSPRAEVSLATIVDRAGTTVDLDEGSIRNHLDLWRVGIQIAVDRPFFGAGQDTYVLLFEEYRDRVLTPERATIMARFRPESPHNVPVAIAGGVGIPALLLYLVLTGGVALMLIASTRRSAGIERVTRAALLAAIMGHLVTDLFMTADVTGSWLFWVYLGAGRALADACAEREPSGATRSELSPPLRQDPSPAR